MDILKDCVKILLILITKFKFKETFKFCAQGEYPLSLRPSPGSDVHSQLNKVLMESSVAAKARKSFVPWSKGRNCKSLKPCHNLRPPKLHSIFLLDSIGQNRSRDSAQIQGKAKQPHLSMLEWRGYIVKEPVRWERLLWPSLKISSITYREMKFLHNRIYLGPSVLKNESSTPTVI